MPKVRIANGLNVHYLQVGAGPDLVLIHGLFSNLAAWNFGVTPALADSLRILTYDLRGHGYTEMTESGYSPAGLATDLKQLLDALGIQRCSVVGHSLGADVALYFAFLYPERAANVILSDPPLRPFVQPEALDEDESRRLRLWWVDFFGKFGIDLPASGRFDEALILEHSARVTNQKWGPLKGMTLRLAVDSKRREWMTKLIQGTALTSEMALADGLTPEKLAEITIPIHVVFDEVSPFCSERYRLLLAHLPNLQSDMFAALPGDVPHLGPIERPKEFAALVRRIVCA